jgi:hypothetical protein
MSSPFSRSLGNDYESIAFRMTSVGLAPFPKLSAKARSSHYIFRGDLVDQSSTVVG